MEGSAIYVNPIGMAFTTCMAILLIMLPRRYATLPIMMIGCYMTLGQLVYLAPFHFSMMRIMILIGFIRVIIRRELKSIKLNALDKGLSAWVISAFLIYNMREQNTDALVYRLGQAYNALGLYFLFRLLIRDYQDILNTVKMLAIIAIPLSVTMLNEKMTGRNMFSIFGGVDEFVVIRDGVLRCQGPFRHPILAGTFGATVMPLCVGLFMQGRAKTLPILGFCAATMITITSASSGPALSYMAGLIAFGAWPLRAHMRAVRWGIVIVLATLHIVMTAPVWYLMSKVSGIIGGTGWHRSELITQAINHIDEWWLWGTNYTAHWMPYTLTINPDETDITNQYIFEGVNGGIISMIMFIIMIALSFRIVGDKIKRCEKQGGAEQYVVWGIGAALFVHIVTFMSVTYFDQMIVFWFLLLAMIASFENDHNSALTSAHIRPGAVSSDSSKN